ncbi:ABC transporter permease [Lachnospiraceae bacterium]|nr:ABC transporter permease [Lachnospiraceae bacterium]
MDFGTENQADRTNYGAAFRHPNAQSLVIAFSGVMIENVIKDVTPFLLMVVGETADSCINVKAESEEDFLRELNGDGRVEKAYLYHSLSVSHNGGVELMATLCDDFSKQNNQGVVFKGRFPKYDNEITIAAKYAKENGLEIGDEIEITANGTQETYLICGYTQISNNLGRDCLMTRRGYERMATLTDASYYINLTEETDIDTFNLEAEEKFDVKVNATVNIDTTIKATTDVYISLMTMIVTAVLALSAIIVVFVLYLLVRTMLNCKIHDYRIMKALGFTTGQLVLQTALSFMPEAILSVEVGLMISSFIINPLTALFLSGIGFVSCTFHVPVGFIVFAAIGLILFAFLTACLLSLRIRKITPKALFSGE